MSEPQGFLSVFNKCLNVTSLVKGKESVSVYWTAHWSSLYLKCGDTSPHIGSCVSGCYEDGAISSVCCRLYEGC